MRKLLTGSMSALLFVLILLSGLSQTEAQYRTTTWEKSAKLNNRPAWMSTTNTERGLAYGNDKVYVTSTNAGTFVQVLSAATGELSGTLDMTGVSGGSGASIADVETDANGSIYACNLVVSAATSAFKIYRWANDAAVPENIISFTGAGYRLGDKFTVVGSAANNSLTIYAATASMNKVYKWTTADNGATFAVDSITLAGYLGAPGSSPAVYPLTSGASEFIFKANGSTARRYAADGSAIDTVGATLLPSGSNALRYFTTGGRKYVAFYQYSGTPQNGIRFIDVTDQYSTQHLLLDYTPNIGAVTNGNGTGDLAMKVEGDGSYSFYMLATNNGIAAYRYYFGALPNSVAVNSFPYAVSFDNGLITDAGWSGNFADRGTESKAGAYAARFLYNYIPTTLANIVYGYLVSPRIELPADYRVRFWWKDDDITGVAGADTTFFEVSTDNGLNWTTLRTLSSTGSMAAYVEEIVDLGSYAGNNFRMRFRDKTNGSFSAYGTGIDEILLEAKPAAPVMVLNPTSTAFGNTYVGGNMQKTVLVSNTGGAALTGTLTLPALITANTTSLNVASGGSFNLVLTYTPTAVGALDDSILFATNDPANASLYYKLTGTAVEPFVLNEIVQNFDTSTGTIPANWAGNFTVNATGGVGNSKRLTRNLYSSTPTGFFTTPFFNATASSQLKFKYRVVNYTGYPATGTPGANFKVYVSVSTNLGGSFTVVDSIGEHNHVVGLDYVEKSWNLAAYAGQKIQVRINGQWLVGDFYVDFDDWFMGTPSVAAIDWGNLQWPPTATITQGNNVTAYGQAYKAGVTDSTGQAFGLNAWVGISSTNTNPANWTTWIPATFNVQVGNNDEFMADFGATLPVGTHYYAFRYQYLGGPYRYGGTGGFWDSTASVNGVLTVNPYSISSFPYTQSFDDVAFPPTAWVLENKNAGPTWTRSTLQPRTGLGHARYSYSSTLPGDDWLISPAIQLTAGQMIQLSYWYKAQSGYPEKMKVMVGKAQTADSLTTQLADHPNITNAAYENNAVFFTAPATGLYYIGFQSYSAADQWYLDLDDITISAPPVVDYAVVDLDQGAPAESVAKLAPEFKLSKEKNEIQFDGNQSGVPATNVNNSRTFSWNGSSGLPVETNVPVYLWALVKRLGTTGPAYTVNTVFNGVAGTPVNKTGIGTIGSTEGTWFAFNQAERGTFSAFAYVQATGDSVTNNDTLYNHKVLVYPDSATTIAYDQAETAQLTSIGYGTNNLPLTAGVRFTATQNIKLNNIDAIYRNEGSSDSIHVRVWAAGVDTTAPGALLYEKKFAGINYINSGTGLQYVTLPLGNDAPAFLAGSDYWVSISFVATIQFPMGAHVSASPNLGRSFLSQNDGVAWVPLVLSSTPYVWIIRSVGTPYTPPPAPVYTTAWQKSAAQGALPTWFSATGNTERGMAFGKVSDGTRAMVDRLFVVSRNGGNFVKVIDPETGNDLGDLNTTGITGGAIVLNDIESSEDGILFASNVANAAGSIFKVYRWNSLTAAPEVAIQYTLPASPVYRLGDKIRVTGRVDNNTAVIWAADANGPRIFKFGMTAGVFNTVPDIVTLSNGAFGGSASVAVLPNGDFYYNAGGKNVMKYAANGSLIDTLPGSVVATGSNSIVYLGSITRATTEYVATFAYGAGNENAYLVSVPDNNPELGTLYGKTVSLGSNANVNGAGDVAIRYNNDNTITVFVLSTNNGFGAYKLLNVVPVELTSFAASANGSSVTLNWSTATETNSSVFVVERKNSATDWASVGTVNAAGTSTAPLQYTYIDKNVESGKYSYRLRQIDLDGTAHVSDAIEVEVGLPSTFNLSQNYPNPFNPSTKVNFSLPLASHVTLDVFDVAGQKVATIVNGQLTAGYHTVDIDAQKYGLSSGIYLYRIVAGEYSSVKKMILMK